MRQDGRIVAVALIALPGRGVVGAGELNGIAVASDGSRLWLSLSESVVEIPAFGASR